MFDGCSLGLAEGREQSHTDHGDRLSKHESHPVVEGLGADDSVLAREDLEATEAGVLLVILVPFGQEALLVDEDAAGDIFLAHFCQHKNLFFHNLSVG